MARESKYYLERAVGTPADVFESPHIATSTAAAMRPSAPHGTR
jgi:hypothetical protein